MVLTSICRNLPTSQKPPSFRWESTTEPAATAMVRAATCTGLAPEAATPGAISPAAVVSATVAEPWATRITAAMRKPATISGMPSPSSRSASALPIPLARRTEPNMPPAPVTRTTEHIGGSARSSSSWMRSLCSPRATPSTSTATSSVISRATGVVPTISTVWNHGCLAADLARTPALTRVVRVVPARIRTMGSSRIPSTVPQRGGFCGASVSASPNTSGTGRWMRRATDFPNT